MKKNHCPDPDATVEFEGASFSHETIFKVVNSFYHKVQEDEVLKVPFSSVKDWDRHIKKLTNFWWIKLGGKPYLGYRYNPIAKHYEAGFDEHFLKHWLSLFSDTLKEHLSDQQFDVWMSMAERIGNHLTERDQVFRQKIIRENMSNDAQE